MSSRFRKTLSNGLRLVGERLASSRSVSVAAWVGVGSAFETPANTGISHFVEHLVFKGTKKRNPKEIVGAIERVGGEINAFTEREDTCFHATVLAKDLKLAVEVLADLVLNPLFPKEEIARERGVLLQEWAATRESPEEYISDEFCRRAWRDQASGFPILGQPKVLRTFDRAKIHAFHRAHYTTDNLVVGAAGNVDFREFEEACKKAFRNGPRGKGKAKGPLAGRLPQVKFHPFVRQERFESDQIHWLAGFEGVPLRDANRFESIVLSFILGGGMSSRLFQEVREKEGLAYTIDCDSVSYLFGGLFSFYAATSAGAYRDFIRVMRREITRLKQDGISADELKSVQEQIHGAFQLSWEYMEARQEFLCRHELFFGASSELKDILRGIDEVTTQSMYAFIQRVFQKEKQACLLLGPRDNGSLDLSLVV